MQRQILRPSALFLLGEDPVDFLLRQQRAVRVVRALGLTPEPAVVVDHEIRCEGVGRIHVGDFARPELLDETILENLVGPFDAAFCGGAVAQITAMFKSNIARPHCV